MTTSRLLPETDLARIALLPDDQKRTQLRRVKFGIPPHSYAPLRKVVSATFAARTSLLDLPTCAWADIDVAIRKYCRANLHWIEPNITLAKTLFDFNRKRAITAVEWDFPVVPIGFGAKIKFWHDFYSVQDDAPVLSFIDARLKDGLTTLGRTFVFSAMYHNVAVGDFHGARLEILRFPKDKESGDRNVNIYSFDKDDLIDERTLNDAIDRTYKIWQEILLERAEEARRYARTGTDGTFGF